MATDLAETARRPRNAVPIRSSAWRSASTSRTSNLYYGDFHAVQDVTMTIEPNQVTALIGSSGCGKTTVLRSLNRMHELTPGATGRGRGRPRRPEHLRAERRPRRGPPAGRDGLPGAEPVPDDVGLRERRRRPDPQPEGDLEVREGRDRGGLAARRAPLGGGQGSAGPPGLRPLRRPAAAALHRPRDRRRARGAADGRALLGARPGRDPRGRGPDRGSEEPLHDRDRHPQHAAGGARQRRHRLLQPRGGGRARHAWSRWTRPTRSSPRPPRRRPRTTSAGGSADARGTTPLPGPPRRAWRGTASAASTW